MAVRLFAPSSTLNLPVTTTAAALQLSPVGGTALRIVNSSSNEACVLITPSSANVVVVPVSTSSSLNGMSIPGITGGGAVVGIDASQQGATGLWISAICPVATATTNLRITQGEGGLT